MAKVGVVTDSTNMIPADLIQELGIQVVPLGFVCEEKLYIDYRDLTIEKFWEMFPMFTKQPTTRTAGPGNFHIAFEELSKSTDSIVCVTISKAFSAACSAANVAAEMDKSEYKTLNIEVIDSKYCQGALGFIALESARAAASGKNLAEVTEIANGMIPRVGYIMAMDAVEYLVRIGRAPKELGQGKQQAKPILGIVKQTGVVENLGKIATMQEAPPALAETVSNYIESDKPVHFMIHYSKQIQEFKPLRELIEKNTIALKF
jgi:DegV family protein with EDD domain